MEEEIIKRTKQLVDGATLSGKLSALMNIAERVKSEGLLTQSLLDVFNMVKEEYRAEQNEYDQN